MDRLDLLFPTSAAARQWTQETIQPYEDELAHYQPEELLRWAVAMFAPHLALATSFGPSGIVIMHMMAALRPQTTIFYLDTALLFPETYALRDQLAERLGLQFTRVATPLSLDEQADQFGPDLWQTDPDQCCHLRKVIPLRRFLAHHQAWITGIRRDQGGGRASIQPIAWDYANHLVKLNPLAHWSREQVWAYIHKHDLPYNHLHDEGFASIGCIPCTRAIQTGEAERDGRWAGQDKNECGIHIQPDGRISRTTPPSI